MNNFYRTNFYRCEGTPTHKQKVNCIHWNMDESICKPECKLNLFDSPTAQNCSDCKQRESYPKEVLEEDKKTNPFTNLTISSKPQVTVKNVVSYAKSESSQFFHGTVDEQIYNERKEQCMSCPNRVNNVNKATDEIGWCTACGCGTGTERTRLSVKLKMPALMCPKGKFPAAIGKGFNIKDSIDSVKGVIKIVSKIL
jgi:hypothetical protein